MLSRILSKEQCANCRFCCSFVRSSTWETPIFTKDHIQKLIHDYKRIPIKPVKQGFTFDLSSAYKTESAREEAACPFLNPQTGCILAEEDKPFDCKIWPLRIMLKGKEYVIALTPTCPSINEIPLSNLKRFVAEGIGDKIYEQAKLMPSIIKDYKEGFPVLMRHSDIINHNKKG